MNFPEEKSNMFQSGRGHVAYWHEKNMKHALGRGCWVLAFCQVSSNSVQQLQGYQKCLSQSDAMGPSLFSNQLPKNTNFVENFVSLLPLKFDQIPFGSL